MQCNVVIGKMQCNVMYVMHVMYVCMYDCMFACMYVSMYVCMYARMCVYLLGKSSTGTQPVSH